MRYSVIALALVSMILVSGCSDDEGDEAVEPEVLKPAITLDVPVGIKGYPFETGGKCAIDVVNTPQMEQVITISRADGMSVDGWAFDDKKNSVPLVVALQLAKGEDRYHVILNRHGGREDLVAAFGRSEFSNAGYAGTFDIAQLPAGQYDVLVIQRGKETNLVCPTYRMLVLND